MAKSPTRPDDESADLLGSRPAPAGPAPYRPSGYLIFLAGTRELHAAYHASGRQDIYG